MTALFLASARRVASAPDLPTIAEAGLPGFEFSVWFALFAPKGLPADVQQQVVFFDTADNGCLACIQLHHIALLFSYNQFRHLGFIAVEFMQIIPAPE